MTRQEEHKYALAKQTQILLSEDSRNRC